MKIKVKLSIYATASRFVAQVSDTPALCGVSIAPCSAGGILVTACNGAFLAVMHDDGGSCDRPIVVEPVIISDPGKADPLYYDYVEITRRGCKMPNCDEYKINKIKHKYPDFSSLIPSQTPSSAPCSVDSHYLGYLERIAEAYGQNSEVALRGCGYNKTVIVRFGKNVPAIALIAGYKFEPELEIPQWFKSEPKCQN